MSIHPGSTAHLAMHAAISPDDEVTLPARSGVQTWLQELAENELVMDCINPRELTQRIMQDAFGRYSLPPRVSGMLAASHLLRDADPQDRQGIRQLATAWFTSMPPSAVDESTWFVRQAVRRPQTPHLTLVGNTGEVTELFRCNARDGRILLVSESNDAATRRWDPGTGEETDEPVDSPLSGISARREATFTNAYGRTLLAVPDGNNVKITDRATGEEVGVPLRGHGFQVTAVSSFYGPAGRPLLASASRDHTIRIWDPASKSRPAARSVEQLDEMQVVTWFTAPDGSPRVGTIRNTYDDVLQIWETDTGQWVGELNARPGQPWTEARSVRFTTRRGDQMLAVAEQESLRIWDLGSEQLAGEPLTGHAARINDVLACAFVAAFAPQRRMRWFLWGFALSGLTMALTALAPADQFGLGAAFWLLSGLTFAVGNAPFMAMLQSAVPNHLQGRVLSLLNTLIGLAGPVGLALAAPLGEALGSRWLFVLLGACGLRDRKSVVREKCRSRWSPYH